ncbi:hypothetical protein [Streptomyces sp. NPDC057340]|uniref:hypothetical protein n=1 Tax=Streptomyces sp. NPDC057340 TaxID=3346103 RepID=UPI0036441A90
MHQPGRPRIPAAKDSRRETGVPGEHETLLEAAADRLQVPEQATTDEVPARTAGQAGRP